MPRSMPALAVIPAIEIMSMYSTRRGPTPLATTGGDGAGHLLDGGERGQQGGLVLGPGMEAEDGPGDQGQGALGADDRAG